MKKRYLPLVAAAVAMGLGNPPSRADQLSDSKSVQVTGKVQEYETITPVDYSVVLEPVAVLNPVTGESQVDMTKDTGLWLGANTPLAVAVLADRQLILTHTSLPSKILPCKIKVSCPAGPLPPPLNERYVWGDYPTGKQAVYYKGLVGPAIYYANVNFTVDPTVWTVTDAGGTYAGATTLTVMPADWPGGVMPASPPDPLNLPPGRE